MSERKRKKKKIYSKDKTPYLYTTQKIENPMQLMVVLKEKENVWSEYVDKVIYQDQDTEQHLTQDLKYIMSHMSHRPTRQAILKQLMQIEGYNPFIDDVPLDKLSNNYCNYIKKLQAKIQSNLIELEKISIVEKNLVFNQVRYNTAILEYTKNNCNKELFAMGYDFVILHKEGRFLFNSNPKLKDVRPNLTRLYDILSKSEPDKWYLHGSANMLITKEGCFSHFNLKQILLFVGKMK